MENKELKDFVIDDTNAEITLPEMNINDVEITSSTDGLEQFDFSSDTPFNIEENYELVEALKKVTEQDSMKELVKLREAKNIIEKHAKTFLKEEFVDKFNSEEANLLAMIKKYDANIEEIRLMTDEQKDKIYSIAQYLFNVYQKKLNDITFNFPLTKNEVHFIFDVFRKKLEYDQNEVFQLKELKDNYLDKEFEKQEDGNFMTFINVNDLIVFYHLISKYKVKGITQEHYDFLTILTKIAERIKLFNAYNVVVQRLSDDFQLWGGSLDVGELNGTVLDPVNDNDGVTIIKETGAVVE